MAYQPATAAGHGPRPSVGQSIYEHVHRHRAAYKALWGKQGGAIVHTHLHRLVDGLLRDHLRPHLTAIGSDLPVEVVAELRAAAALGPLVWLVDQDFPYDPAALATMYHRVAVPGVPAVPAVDMPARRSD